MKQIIGLVIMLCLSIVQIDAYDGVQREKPRILGATDKQIPEGYSIDLRYGIRAIDDQDGDLTRFIDVSPHTIDTTVPGKHTVIYSVYDIDGNLERVSIQIEVLGDKTIINVSDLNLRARINYYLKQDVNDPITLEQAQTIKSMDISNRNITSLEGMQYFHNIEYLNFKDNEIKDISQLNALSSLTSLDLSYNEIEDITPVTNLIYLSTLNLSNNQISNVDAISTFQGQTLRLHDQVIQMGNMFDDENNEVNIVNPIKDENGRPIEPYNVDYYDSVNNIITWKNIRYDKDVSFNFTKAITIGGRNTVFKGEVLVPIKNVDYNQPTVTTGFKDINNHWAKSSIDRFVEGGYIKGYSDNTFRPNSNITRAEFVAIFNKYFGLTSKSGKVFSDTIGHWAQSEIDIAVTNNIVNGVNANEFKPNSYLTREQAAVIINNYLNLPNENGYVVNKYIDSNRISSWAKLSVEGVLIKGYMGGYSDNTFRPLDNITRAEAVVVLDRIK